MISPDNLARSWVRLVLPHHLSIPSVSLSGRDQRVPCRGLVRSTSNSNVGVCVSPLAFHSAERENGYSELCSIVFIIVCFLNSFRGGPHATDAIAFAQPRLHADRAAGSHRHHRHPH